jgi:hypothetical protein
MRSYCSSCSRCHCKHTSTPTSCWCTHFNIRERYTTLSAKCKCCTKVLCLFIPWLVTVILCIVLLPSKIAGLIAVTISIIFFMLEGVCLLSIADDFDPRINPNISIKVPDKSFSRRTSYVQKLVPRFSFFTSNSIPHTCTICKEKIPSLPAVDDVRNKYIFKLQCEHLFHQYCYKELQKAQAELIEEDEAACCPECDELVTRIEVYSINTDDDSELKTVTVE